MVKITETISTTERVPNLDAIYGPYQSITEAENALRDAERNVLGATVGVIEDGKIKEYWYKENTTELVLKGGEGGGVDPELEERVEDLEQNKVDKVNEVHKIIPQTPVYTYDNSGLKHSDGHIDTASDYKVLEYEVEPGKTYFVSGQTGDGSSLCLGAFLNNITEGTGTTGTLVGSALFPQNIEENRHRDFSRETIIAPSGATHIRIQQINSYGHNADLELYESKTINVVDDIYDLNKSFDELSTKVDELDEVVNGSGGSSEQEESVVFTPVTRGFIDVNARLRTSSSSSNYYSDAIDVRGWDKVRFLGAIYTPTSTAVLGAAFFDSNDNTEGTTGHDFIQYPKTAEEIGPHEYTLDVPDGAVYFRFTIRKTDYDNGLGYCVLIKEGGASKKGLVDLLKKEIRVLCIGNSYTPDAFSYAPYICKNISPDTRVVLGLAFHGSQRFQDHYNAINNDTEFYTYFKFDTSYSTAWDGPSDPRLYDKKFSEVINDENWDVICLHGQSSEMADYANYQGDGNWLDNILRMASEANGKAMKNVILLTHPKGDDISARKLNFDNISTAVQKALMRTTLSDVIPCGTAIQLAYSKGMDSVGLTGFMEYDSNHLQEGIGCYIEALVASVKILNWAGITDANAINDIIIPTAGWLSNKNIPWTNGSSVGATEDNCKMAREVASIAIGCPFSVDDGLITHPADSLTQEQIDALLSLLSN